MLAIVGSALCIFLGRCSGVTGFKSTSEDRFWLGNSADPDEKAYEPRHVIYNILTSVDSDEPVQPPLKRRNSKCC